jgi:hypothetical protein
VVDFGAVNLRDNGRSAAPTAGFRWQMGDLKPILGICSCDHFISGKVISEGWANAVGSALAEQFANGGEVCGDAGTALSAFAEGPASDGFETVAHAGCGRAPPCIETIIDPPLGGAEVVAELGFCAAGVADVAPARLAPVATACLGTACEVCCATLPAIWFVARPIAFPSPLPTPDERAWVSAPSAAA